MIYHKSFCKCTVMWECRMVLWLILEYNACMWWLFECLCLINHWSLWQITKTSKVNHKKVSGNSVVYHIVRGKLPTFLTSVQCEFLLKSALFSPNCTKIIWISTLKQSLSRIGADAKVCLAFLAYPYFWPGNQTYCTVYMYWCIRSNRDGIILGQCREGNWLLRIPDL